MLAEDGGFFGSKRHPIAYKIEGKTWVNNHAHVLRPLAGLVDFGYFHRYLSFLDVSPFLSGSTRAKLTKTDASRIPILFPKSLPIQKKIANIIDHADTLVTKRQKAIQLAGATIQSMFLKMFGDPKANPMKWKKVSLQELAVIERETVLPENIMQGTKDVGLEHIEKDSGEILGFLEAKPGDVKSNKFAFTSNHLLYGKLRPYLNKVAMPEFAGVCSTDILPILPREGKATREYVAYLLKHPYFVAYATEKSTGANLPRISPKEIERFEAPAPPIELQERFSAFVSSLRKLSLKQDRSAQQINELFHCLMHKAFKGDLKIAS